jgi:hypothetical protein
MGILLGRQRTPLEQVEYFIQMAGINPNGFRQPSNKHFTWVEKLTMEAGLASPDELREGPSERRRGKLSVRKYFKESFKARQASGYESRAFRKKMHRAKQK